MITLFAFFVLAVAKTWSPAFDEFPYYLYRGLAFVVLGAIGWDLYQTPCPTCHKPFGWLGITVIRAAANNVNHCPHCGFSLDRQMPMH